jgi:predicted MPP superfamily phosphohydrolase
VTLKPLLARGQDARERTFYKTSLLLLSLLVAFLFAILPIDLDAASLYLPPHRDFRILVISDLNSQYGSTEYEPEIDRAIALVPQWQPDLVLCGGDMIAGQKATLTQEQVIAMWQAFDHHVAQPLREANIPFGFTIGNHDGSGAIVDDKLIFKRERDLAATYWNSNQQQLGLHWLDRTNFPFYYTFKQQDIFFLVWDASTSQIDQQQLAWIETSLQSEAAQNAKLRLIIGHLPLYAIATAKNKPGEYLTDAETLRSLLEKYRVHTYFSGHHHAYYPGKKGKLELLHAGALGQGARQLIGSTLPPRQTVTIVDWNLEEASSSYTTYNLKTLKLIELKELPRSITGDNSTIWRRDVAV